VKDSVGTGDLKATPVPADNLDGIHTAAVKDAKGPAGDPLGARRPLRVPEREKAGVCLDASPGLLTLFDRRERPGVPGDRGRRPRAELGHGSADLRAVRVAADVRGGSVAAIAQGRKLVVLSG
jgi:hypothetical protein